jgi:hypothetical protein
VIFLTIYIKSCSNAPLINESRYNALSARRSVLGAQHLVLALAKRAGDLKAGD